jgi:hypothetical protein
MDAQAALVLGGAALADAPPDAAPATSAVVAHTQLQPQSGGDAAAVALAQLWFASDGSKSWTSLPLALAIALRCCTVQ